VVVGAGDRADEAVLTAERHGATARLNGKRPILTSCPAPLRPSGERPATTISGSVKQTAGTQTLSHARGGRDDLRHHLALRHRPVSQHRLAGHVADGVDAAHGRPAPVVDPNEPAVAIQIDLLEAPPLVARLAATVTRILSAATLREGTPALSSATSPPARPFTVVPVRTSTPSSRSRLATGPRQLGIVLRQDPVLRFDDRDG
jgi:hypothetical protein